MTTGRRRRDAAGTEDMNVCIRAGPAHLRVIRTVVGTMALQSNFSSDAVADLKVAIDEACSILVRRATEGAELHCRCRTDSDGLHFSAAVRTNSAEVPDLDSFYWRVLSVLSHTALSWIESDAEGTADYLLHVEVWQRRVTTW